MTTRGVVRLSKTGQAEALFGVSAEKLGEGAGLPGLARSWNRITVSTRQTPRAVVFHTPSGWRPSPGPCRIIRRSRCRHRRGADMTHGITADIGPLYPRRAASRRTPSIDVRRDPRNIHLP